MSASLDRDLYKRDDNTWLPFVSDQSGAPIPGQNCTIDPSVFYQCEVSGRLSLSGLHDKSLSIGVLCTTGCVSGFSAHDVRADLDHAVVTISDPVAPVAPTATGALTQASWHSGTASLDVSSADNVGISQVQVTGTAGTVLASATLPCDYTYTAPCPQANGLPLQVDTRRLPDGIDPVTVGVTDAAHNTAVTTIPVMIANVSPPPPVLSGAPDGPTARPSATITARLASAGVPIVGLDWMLCASSCGPAQSVAVPSGAATATFAVNAPADGAYTIQAYAVDAAGHRSSVARAPFDLERGGSGAAVSLPAGPNAGVTLPPAFGNGGIRLLLSVHRRAHGRLQLDVRTRPRRTGRVRIRLTFAGHPEQRRTVVLRRGVATVSVRIPRSATRLTVALAGLGANVTSHIRLASRPPAT